MSKPTQAWKKGDLVEAQYKGKKVMVKILRIRFDGETADVQGIEDGKFFWVEVPRV